LKLTAKFKVEMFGTMKRTSSAKSSIKSLQKIWFIRKTHFRAEITV